jgi:hypothetical protein
MGPTGCHETSVANYQFTVLNISEERSLHFHRRGSLESRSGSSFDIPKDREHFGYQHNIKMQLRGIGYESYWCITKTNAVENFIRNLGHGFLRWLGNCQLAVETSPTSVSLFSYKLQYVSKAALGSTQPLILIISKGKAVPLQACSDPEGSRFHDNGTRWC